MHVVTFSEKSKKKFSAENSIATRQGKGSEGDFNLTYSILLYNLQECVTL